MRETVVLVYRWMRSLGLDLRRTFHPIKGVPAYFSDYRQFKKGRKDDNAWKVRLNFPCLTDRYEEGGTAKGHYFHQDLWAARKIYRKNPLKHVDVGSSVNGFAAHVATFREIEVFDVRPLTSKVINMIFKQMDIMSPSRDYFDYTDSLSCLHALEHFGLGRYNDPVCYDGYLRGIAGLHQILKPGGFLYLSVPIAKEPRIDFNAHRIFSIDQILRAVEDKFTPR